MAKKAEKAPKAEKAAKAAKGGKAKKKKWSKGKTRDKLNNACLFDQETYQKLLSEVPSYKLITPSVVSDRLKIKGSLARKAIRELTQKGSIKPVAHHASQYIYTRATAAAEGTEEK